jgi:hypothetical protein
MKLYYFDTLQPRKVCAAAKYLKAPVSMSTSICSKANSGRRVILRSIPTAKSRH